MPPPVVHAILLLLLAARLYLVLPTARRRSKRPGRAESDTCSLAVFLGSGGHTGEALALASALDFSRYRPRTYVVGAGDVLSVQKAVALERRKAEGTACADASPSVPVPVELHAGDSPPFQGAATYKLVTVPRARRVHQSLPSVPLTTLYSFVACVCMVMPSPPRGEPFADVLILNGPGTCVPLCAAVLLSRFVGLPAPKMIYVESFARVRTLSLSGKILRRLVDRFVVQWPEQLALAGERGECHGCLV